jgi:hypothetical protein
MLVSQHLRKDERVNVEFKNVTPRKIRVNVLGVKASGSLREWLGDAIGFFVLAVAMVAWAAILWVLFG